MVLSFKEIQAFLFIVYGAIAIKIVTKSICKVALKQKTWKEIIKLRNGKSKRSW